MGPPFLGAPRSAGPQPRDGLRRAHPFLGGTRVTPTVASGAGSSVAARKVVDGGEGFEAALGVEGGGLKRERHQDHLPAAAASRLPLGRVEEPCSQPLPPPRLFHPELANLATAAPRVAADPGHDPAALVLDEDCEPFAVPVSRCPRVELVEPVLQVLDLLGRRILEFEIVGHAGLTRLYMTASEGPEGNTSRLFSKHWRRAPPFPPTRWLRVLPTAITISSRFRSVSRNAYAATWRTAAGATPRPAAELRTQ